MILLSLAATLALVEISVRVVLFLAEPSPRDPVEALRRSVESELEPDTTELSLKGLVRASPHEDVVFELKPGLTGMFLGQPVRTNLAGFRDRDYARRKPEGVFRIVGLGDSVMFGWGVSQEEPYLEILERRLAALEGTDVVFEVLNCGVPGYNTAMEVATFEHKALAYEPDLVIIHFIRNDLKLPHFLQRPRDLWTLGHWYSKDLVKARLRLLSEYREQLLLPHDLSPFDRDEQDRAREQYRHMEGEVGFRRAMTKLGELTRQRSIPVVVVLTATDAMPYSLAAEMAKAEGFELLLMGPYFSRYLTEKGRGFDRQAWTEAFFLSAKDHHPNPPTHELYAEALLHTLEVMDVAGLGSRQQEP